MRWRYRDLSDPFCFALDGGAYITLDADDVFMGVTGARNQAHYAQVDVLSVAHRLAPGSKHPSQLYEALFCFSTSEKFGLRQDLHWR